MSVKMIHLVWELPQRGRAVTAAKQRVLLALADTANDKGLCWPGNETVAKKCGVTRRNAQKQIRALERTGLLEKSPRLGPDGRQTSNLYRLLLPGCPWVDNPQQPDVPRGVKSDTPQPAGEGCQGRHPSGASTSTPLRGVGNDTGGVSETTPPSNEPSVEPSTRGGVTEGSVTGGEDGAVSPPGFLSEFTERERRFVAAAYEVKGWPLPDVWDGGLHRNEFNNARAALKLISEGDEVAALNRLDKHKKIGSPRVLLEIAAEPGKIPRRTKADIAAEADRRIRENAAREDERRRAEIAEAEREAATDAEARQHIAEGRATLMKRTFVGGNVR